MRAKAFVLVAWLLAGGGEVAGQTPFTFQGKLNDTGNLSANGQYDLRLGLWDAATGGNPVGTVLTAAPVTTSNGVFTVTLDFGASVFTGVPRWLEISVRTNGSAQSYQTLAPRQLIHYVPQAVYALTVADGAVTAAKIGGELNSASIPNLDAAKITSGTIVDARISGAIARGVEVTNLVNATSNTFSTRLLGTNDALAASINSLSAQVAALNASLTALSNRTETNILAAASFVSADPADANLLALGLRNVAKVAASSWINGTSTGSPSVRSGHTSVWTGQEMIVWGGALGTGYSGAGASYRPEQDAWTTVSIIGAPSARSGHAAVWTGSKMLVWGGFSGSVYLNSGAGLSLSDQVWSAITTAGAPAGRGSHVAAWTGSQMVIWGGRDSINTLGNGAAYNPANNSWTALPAPNAPPAAANASAVWTGDRLLIWGGDGDTSFLNSGAQLLFSSGAPSAWATINVTGAPSPRSGHTAVWTGTRMIVWGGYDISGNYLGNGASYDPVANTWSPISTVSAPTARALHNAVWSGSCMIVYGGENLSGTQATGAAYDPATDKWQALSNPGTPQARSQSTVVWTGSEMIFFGGRSNGSPLSALQRLNPQPTWYFFRKS